MSEFRILPGVRIAAATPAGGAMYYLGDQVESVKVTVDDRGIPVSRMEYLPYGETWFQQGDQQHTPKYNSQELDKESGFYFYNERHYDAEIGRFITADKIIDGVYDTQGWNRYMYVRGNPIRYMDPTGYQVDAVKKVIDSGMAELNQNFDPNSAEQCEALNNYYEAPTGGGPSGGTPSAGVSSPNPSFGQLPYGSNPGIGPWCNPLQEAIENKLMKALDSGITRIKAQKNRDNPVWQILNAATEGLWAKTTGQNADDPAAPGSIFADAMLKKEADILTPAGDIKGLLTDENFSGDYYSTTDKLLAMSLFIFRVGKLASNGNVKALQTFMHLMMEHLVILKECF